MSGKHRVLLIGCGQLGSRHLQAVASLPQVREIEVVDPRPEGLSLGQSRLADLPDLQPHIQLKWLSRLDDASRGGDLCIVATQAEGRAALVEQVAALGYRSFLLEKIVTQSLTEYRRLIDLTQDKMFVVYVNCQERTYPFHQYVKSSLDPAEPIVFTAVGGNHGLACNGIHEADLFAFYTGCHAINGAGASVDSVLHKSKRGETIFDLSGVLIGQSANGSRLILAFAGDHNAPYQVTIASQRGRWVADYATGWAWESRPENNWTWHPIEFEGELRVSFTTRLFATQIMGGQKCALPTLAECYPAHHFILSELLPHFNRLLHKDDDRCPVT